MVQVQSLPSASIEATLRAFKSPLIIIKVAIYSCFFFTAVCWVNFGDDFPTLLVGTHPDISGASLRVYNEAHVLSATRVWISQSEPTAGPAAITTTGPSQGTPPDGGKQASVREQPRRPASFCRDNPDICRTPQWRNSDVHGLR